MLKKKNALPPTGEEVTEMEGTEESVDTNKFENDDRKLFVGGLTWETTVEQLKAYFEKYGTVKVSCIVFLISNRQFTLVSASQSAT